MKVLFYNEIFPFIVINRLKIPYGNFLNGMVEINNLQNKQKIKDEKILTWHLKCIKMEINQYSYSTIADKILPIGLTCT
ncbi:hypothetical protein [Lysinibacillus capsici]|uniref:hypothetical protein n=1 Tax=Lysinibacillus capsici TaxID=2115968 RepID=UPI001CD940C2|nr:hypothetical protein [Lysinibacillus capsici]